jgi:site-specific DNA recombinase
MTVNLLEKPANTLESELEATAVIYLRVSSTGQLTGHNPEGYSIEAQREACERYAASLGACVVREYIEPGKSATTLRRPQLQQMLSELPDLKPTYVIFYDLSRTARDEFDAFWILREIEASGAKLESTLEPVDGSDTGMLVYTVMAGINAFRSRRDGKKVKASLERKFLDGGTIGVARIGYLNIRENVNGREVAAIAVDDERVAHVQLASDLAATGDHTITSITDVLESVGLRTRGSFKRPSKPMTRSMVHRMLRDDYYTGIVTHNGVKGQGRHEAIIDRATFDQVQKVLDSHRISGDRSHKHHHYLKGTIFCVCSKRLGYGRHRGKGGGQYEYFSCLSRVQREEQCAAPYFPVERTERAIVRRYKRETYKDDEQNIVREALHSYVQSKTEIARRESARHTRRLHDLTGEQQKLVQLYYKGGVSEEVLQAEQERIETERSKAQEWADAATREVEDVMAALDDGLAILDEHVIYDDLPASARRLVNQAVFLAIIVSDPDNVQAQRTPLYETIALVIQELRDIKERPKTRQKPTTPGNKTASPQNDRDPDFRGRGSYIGRMAGATGLEPATSAVTGQRSNLLSYAPAMLVRASGDLPCSFSMARLARSVGPDLDWPSSQHRLRLRCGARRTSSAAEIEPAFGDAQRSARRAFCGGAVPARRNELLDRAHETVRGVAAAVAARGVRALRPDLHAAAVPQQRRVHARPGGKPLHHRLPRVELQLARIALP